MASLNAKPIGFRFLPHERFTDMTPSLILGIPPAIVNLVQQGLLERAFHDGLFPNIAYRQEAMWEEWPANSGTEIFMTRPGLLTPQVKPLTPGVDPTPKNVVYEQWSAILDRYGDSVDVHIPTSVVANANLFLRNIHQLGLQAGQSINRVARNSLFKPYLSGQTLTTVAAAAGDSQIHVASMNGFFDVVIAGTSVRPVPVSPASPLSITIAGVAGSRNVIGVIPDDPTDPFGPGTLVLSAVLGGAGAAARAAVLSVNRVRVVRSGGGASVDAIGAADTFVLQDAINAVAQLRRANVQPHEDGLYHAHISPTANAQVFSDPAFQRLNTALPEHSIYKEGFIGVLAGIAFYMNTESPEPSNSGTRISTGTNAFYSSEIGAETTNDSGVDIGRILITGKGAIYEKGLDESQYVTEAGVTGKSGDFAIVNNGMEVQTDRIRLIMRAPLNRLQDQVSLTWSISTSFPVPSDITAPSGPERYKRAIVIEHALLALPPGAQPGLSPDKGPEGITPYRPFLLFPPLEARIMARNKPESKVKEVLGGSSGQPPEDTVLASPGMSVMAPTQRLTPETLKDAPRKIQYRVMNGGYINMSNGKTAVRAGKIVNDLDFDLKLMTSQGIILERITPPDPEPVKEAPKETKEAPSPKSEK